MKFPKIKHNEKEYYQVGCRDCARGEYWKIYVYKDSLNNNNFLAVCDFCGNKIQVPNNDLTRKPDQ